MQNFKYLVVLSFSLLTLSLQSCLDLLDSDSDKPEIVFGDNIEGVRVWDDSTAVFRKLGIPSFRLVSDIDKMFKYETGRLKYTQIVISDSPLLGNGVINMMVKAPYKGRSKEGIGIGTDRTYVLRKLGEPDRTISTGMYTTDNYHYESNFFSLEYNNNKVESISMFVQVI